MIKRFLSRYHPRYVRSLVYMLQASEYHLGNFFSWYDRVDDFRFVEKRKQLVFTPKVFVLLITTWFFTLAGLFIAVWGISVTDDVPHAVGTGIILFLPIVLPYVVACLSMVLAGIQAPIEMIIIATAKRKLEAHKGFKIAIAGSFGKTTMRKILETVLSEGKKVATPAGNFNTPLGISRFIKTLKGDEDVLIFELGEYYPGDVKKLCLLVQPELGIITGINEAHLEKFKTLDKTAGTIFELADYLGDKTLYINGENHTTKEKYSSGHIMYTRDGAGIWKAENLHTDLSGTSFTLMHGENTFDAKSHLLGLHQVGPLAVATDIAFRLGLSPEQIQRGIAGTKPFDHRLKPHTDATGVITLDDSYNGNPDGVNAVIDFLGSLTGHRRFYVTPGLVEMGSRKQEIHREIGKKLAHAKIEKVILIKNSVTGYIEEGLKEAQYGGEILWFDDALTAFAALPHLTVKGDVVLLQNDWPDQYQ